MTASMRCVLISAESIFDSSTQLNLISSCHLKREVNHVQTNQSILPDVPLLNQLDGFNIQPRISIPFDGAIDPSTVNNNTVFLIRIADTSNPTTFNPQIVGINQVVWDTLTNT